MNIYKRPLMLLISKQNIFYIGNLFAKSYRYNYLFCEENGIIHVIISYVYTG